MKWILSIWLCSPFISLSQNEESSMKPSLWLGIWDNQKNVPGMVIQPVGFNDIPRDINFKGILVEALEFQDANGYNLIFFTQTGSFPVSKKDENGSFYKTNDRAEIYAYLYTKSEPKSTYRQLWKTTDNQECENLDLYIGFTKKSLSITDIDQDGIAELSFQYLKSCRGDVSPSDRYLNLFESSEKYQFSGHSTLEGLPTETPLMDAKTESNTFFKAFLEERWKKFEEDPFIQFSVE